MGNEVSVDNTNNDDNNEIKNKKTTNNDKNEKSIQEEEKKIKKCKMPTKDNPAMNFLNTDSNLVKGYTEACGPSIEVENKIKSFINSGIGENMNLMDRKMNERQFITMPWTTHTNDQTGFANWLYKDLPVCKSKNIDCSKNLVRSSVYNYDKHD